MRKLIWTFLIIVLFSSFNNEEEDWVEPLNIDLEHLETVFLNKVNAARRHRKVPELIKDSGWDSAAASTFNRYQRFKFNSNHAAMKRRMDKYYRLHKKEFDVTEKLALAGAAEYSAMKNGGRYFYDEKRDADFPFFYGFKSNYKVTNRKPTSVARKTYDELAEQLIKTVSSYNNGDIYRRTTSKIGLKFGLSKKKVRVRIPKVKVLVFLGCNTMAKLKI